MSLKIVIDMNLPPSWASFLKSAGWTATHWLQIGDPRATDRDIMDWARAHNHIVLTYDLDFGTLLALTHASGPSILQVRGADVLPATLGAVLLATIEQHQSELIAGALIVVDTQRCRLRILPI